ncbi:MAG: hypothetical protein IT360_03995 [Gemmatimonadaceae bacterium]|nr:hypothetical protein [Gemmatimonadaceae bacterium]
MRRRFLFLFFPVLLVATACGPRARATESAARQRLVDGPPVVSSFDVSTQGDVRFALHVTNNAGKRMELTFPSGLTHDIVVLDDLGREVWRWSEGRMFTQTLQNRILDASETVSYAAEWQPETAHGAFVAVASLRSENHPVEQRVRFVLP